MSSLILTAVQSVADERMTGVRHMYPDLMRPARLQPKFDQRVSAALRPGNLEPFQYLVMRYRRISVLHDPATHIVGIRPADGLIDRSPFLRYHPVENRQIRLLHFIQLHLFHHRILAVRIFRDHQKAAGVHIQAVDKTDFKRTAVLLHIAHETVGNGPDRMPFCRMRHDSGLFIDDQHVLIFIDGVDRNILRQKGTSLLRQFRLN